MAKSNTQPTGKSKSKVKKESYLKIGLEGIKQAFLSIKSKDYKTRRMGYLFYFLFVCFVLTLIFGPTVFKSGDSDSPNKHILDRKAEAEHEKEEELDPVKRVTYRLGSFTVSLHDPAGANPLPGVVNMAELEIILTCDVQNTCDFIEHNEVQFRDAVTPLFGPFDRDELMTTSGKEKVKKLILEKINSMLSEGRVVEIFFPHFIID